MEFAHFLCTKNGDAICSYKVSQTRTFNPKQRRIQAVISIDAVNKSLRLEL